MTKLAVGQMINGKLGLKGKNIRLLFWVMVDGTLQLMIYNAELKCVANIQKTKGGLFISKRSVFISLDNLSCLCATAS